MTMNTVDLIDVDIEDSDFLSNLDIDDDDHDEDHNVDDDSSDTEMKKYYVHRMLCENRLFGRLRPLHLVLSGGFCDDVILWRNKEVSASVLGGSTVNVALQCFVTLVHFIVPVVQFSLLYKYCVATRIPRHRNTERPVGEICSFAQVGIPSSSEDSIFGTNLKRFPTAVGALLILSVVGDWFSLLTLFYLVTLILLTGPILYESYEDSVDTFAERAPIGMKRQFALLNANILSTIQNVIS